jgi:UTP--glucose-1-phosphate uridylyltransferase
MKVVKAVFPVAGLGTRFLPATKASPKEMMPIVDTPLIQYAVNEAVAAGITELIFVTNGSKRAIEDHFDSNPELEANLIAHNKIQLFQMIRNILPSKVSCVFVHQPFPLGLGHAVLCAKELVKREPFAVLLADDLIDCRKEKNHVYNKC